MSILWSCLRLLWWLGAALLPLLLNSYYHSYRRDIGCPTSGDCYTPGWEHLLGIELLIAYAAIVIWPLFAWYVVIQPWRAFAARRRARTTARQSTGARNA